MDSDALDVVDVTVDEVVDVDDSFVDVDDSF